MALATSGGVVGLAVESVLYGIYGSHWTAVCILAAFAFAAPLIVALTFPETSGRRLEDISPEAPHAPRQNRHL